MVALVTAVFVLWSLLALQLGPLIASVAVAALLGGLTVGTRLG